jgi:3'(2'), 5'-bisphosphate nucleotidase
MTASAAADDDKLAAELAAAAGRLLLELRSGAAGEEQSGAGAATGHYTDPGTLRREGDRRSHEFLAAELGRQRPHDALLSEEGADDRARLSASRVWIVDPLDGTREFGEPGRTDWAVHIALWENGSLSAGAVALPAQDTVFSTGGALPGRDAPRPPAQPGTLRLVVSRTRPPQIAERLAARTGAELIPLGSAGAKAAEVIRGSADGYVHSGGQYEWDSAAPVAVALAAGLHASRIDGSALRYNQQPPSVPDILICRPELAGALLEAIGSASG